MNSPTLPEGWQRRRLNEISRQLKAGGTPSRGIPEYWGGDIPFVKIDDLTSSGGELVSTSEFITEKGLQNSSAWLIPEDSVLLAMYASIGEVAINRVPVATNQAIIAMVPERSIVLPEYLALFLKTQTRALLARNIQTTQKNITKGIVEDFEVPVPPINQQQTLAWLWLRCRTLLKTLEQELRLECERKDALVDYLFSHGTRKEQQQECTLGTLPRSWQVTELGALMTGGPQNGIYKPQNQYGEGTSIVRIDDFDQDGRIVTPSFQRVRVSGEEVNLYRLSLGDILINRVNSLSHLGKSMVVPQLPEPTMFESNMMRFSVDETRISSEFLVSYLSTDACRAYVKGRAKRAVAQSSINQGDVKSIRVPLPSLDEQVEIVRLLRATDDKTAAIERQQSLVGELLMSISQAVISGELPLPQTGEALA